MSPDGYELVGKVAIVTGGGEGIGAATARLLAFYGADVVIAGRTRETLERTAESIAREMGSQCLGVQTDVCDEEQVARLVARTVDELGRVDILVNNVGWSSASPLSEMTTEQWKNDFALNVDTAFFCAREVARHFLAQRSGAIVNVSSIAGSNGTPGLAAYSSAKAAMQMFTRVSAAEWGPKGIRVNCVAPGLIATENAMAYYEEVKLDIDAVCSRFPLRRPGRPEEVARAIVFLASDASSYITGETIDITGGPVL